MSTITKQAVQAVADLKAGYTLGHADVAILNELARIALASLEAEAVADVVAWSSQNEERTCDVRLRRHDIKPGPLYTAPPATVSVPAALDNDIDSDDHPLLWSYNNGWNAYRAAMLQGAEPVTTDYKLPFDQWLSQQTGTIDVECGCVMTEVFFHWLRVAYDAGKSPVIPDGWVLVPEEPTHEMLEAGDEQFGTYDVYRRMIEAAPKLE
ncbi:hypothetical protein E6A33_30635 [Escherichia coli]|nr:hypothetical protein [Escherichia coli]